MGMLIVYYVAEDDRGWQPIMHMVRIAAESLEAELLLIDHRRRPTRSQQVRALVPRGRGDETCLVVCRYPTDLPSLLLVPGWRKRFRATAAWVIDSYWTDRLPRLVRNVRLYDHLFVTTEEDIPDWVRLTGTRTTHLPWGSDVLRLGAAKADRRVDLLRVGRQPPEFEEDAGTAEACRALGIRFAGRPPSAPEPEAATRALMARYADSKFVLAFSNSVNPTTYTHPRREYITGRWTDALACGAVVAGVAPAAPDVRRLLWPGATLELGGIARNPGLRVVAAALQDWAPARARENHRQALERLDWRWRFAEIATTLGEAPGRLAAELDELRGKLRRIDRREASASESARA